ncbi:MAG: NYN domain-containing protein [Deltaproteobacteria bacterium]|nr:NYN domain-containing protein [Deltaproteobacteria bacterium]
MAKFRDIEEQVAGVGRELKALLIEQKREIESLNVRLEKLEPGLPAKAGTDAIRQRLNDIPSEKIRVGVFVDVQNMFYAAKKLDGARLDYESMLDRIVNQRRLIKAVAYIVESSEIDQSGFISVLEKKGYQVRRKELKSYMDGTAKGDWDMGMAIDILEMSNHLDVVALVTGDGDFVSLVRLVKKLGPVVELYAFGHNLSSELKETSDKFFEIGSDLLLKNFHHQALAEGAQKQTGPGQAGATQAKNAEKTEEKQ